MEQSKVFEIIKRFTAEGVEIREDSEFFNDLGLSSLEMMSLILALEEELETKINIMELVGIKTVGELVRKVSKG